jgi:DNA repair protein RadC
MARAFVADAQGNYTFSREVTAEEILDIAASILELRIARGDVLSNPADTKRYLCMQIGALEHEVFCCVFLDNRHRIIDFEQMFRGTIDGASVHPREVVKRSLALNAAAVIFAHNHPSGLPEPSQADKKITSRLKNALALVDVRVLDHIVVAGSDSVSLAERGVL